MSHNDEGSRSEATDDKLRSEDLLFEVRHLLVKAKNAAVFCCGGSVPIVADADEGNTRPAKDDVKGENQQGGGNTPPSPVCRPITIRWDSPSGSQVGKLVFPLPNDVRPDDGSPAASLDKLLSDTQPATFGRDGKDVYDETYRKALKLDESAFSTNFNPYTIGIIDQVTNLLLPDADYMVRAELYKLNVYSGPAGEFKAHVDTPRSEAQFGSLVVCLPAAHEGGDLVLNHGFIEKTFCWSSLSSSPCIQWAAFYSDVVHAVKPVTSGRRITLTYNLFRGTSPAVFPLAQPTTLPLYEKLKALLENPEFLRKGGHLGIVCYHAYPHTSRAFPADFQCALKGVDRAVWATFCALGLETTMRPVACVEQYASCDWGADEEHPNSDSEADEKHPNEGDWSIFNPNPGTNILAAPARLNHTTKLHPDQYSLRQEVREVWAKGKQWTDIRDVLWLTRATSGHEELQLVALTYGNQASTKFVYSYATIIAYVPPAWADRSVSGGDEETAGCP